MSTPTSETVAATDARRAFEGAARLPRGPHSLGRDEVAASQRDRLLNALTELLGEGGYSHVTIGRLAQRAGVSRATFYEQFAGKEECVLAAYDRFARAILERMLAGVDDDTPWEAFVAGAIGGYLREVTRDPPAARAFLVELEAAGPAARARRRDAMRGFAAAFTERHRLARERDPALGPLPETVFAGLVLGVRELVRERLEQEPEPDLLALAPDIELWVGAMVAGA